MQERFIKDHGLLDHRDLYILEQRGIGASQDFCLFYGIGFAAVGLSLFLYTWDLGPF